MKPGASLKAGDRVFYMSNSPARLTAGVFVRYARGGRFVILTKRGEEWCCEPTNVFARNDSKAILSELLYRGRKARRRLEKERE